MSQPERSRETVNSDEKSCRTCKQPTIKCAVKKNKEDNILYACSQWTNTYKKRVYICHPFSGNEENNYWNVTAICQGIVSMGLPVIPFSPINHTRHLVEHLPDPKAWEVALEIDEAMLLACDEVWVFGNWHNSKGCTREVKFAQERGIPVRFIGKEGL
jgi:hypothetical protein